MNAGNTNVTLGVGEEDVILFEKIRRVDESGIRQLLLEIKETYEIEACLLASVVPSQDERLIDIIKSVFECEVRILELKDVPLDITCYTTQLGLDRALTAYAAMNRYPQPFIVFDLGTATSIQVVNQDKFQGGLILSGLRMGLESLHKRTDLLPEVDEINVDKVIATSTETNMLNGAVYGAIGAIEGVGMRIEIELGSECTWILTGGNTRYIRNYLYRDFEVNLVLLLQGMLDVARL
ncbi:type III pantothenate kinase [Erysipelothrix larvae]|nr:type III pantothenate kinase [Erysipelothrix larvae]